MKKQRILSLCMASLLALSLVACNSPTDEQSSTRPTASTQPTAAPTPAPTPPIPFTDVAEDSPYYDAVVWAFKNGIATDGETFEPAAPCTRGQVITFMWRAAGSPEPQGEENPFSDVSPDAWYYKPALWAYENGVASGTAFNPGNPCINAEALTFLWRAEGKPAASVYNSAVALAASGAYYSRPAAWAETNGLFAGTDFDPAAPCSRADLMTYLRWAAEEWTFTEEDQAVQAEYEQIISDAWIYDVHGSGLLYADYVDVDNDGKLELLTVGQNEDFVLVVTVYADAGGHAKKYCEETFRPADLGKFCGLSVGTTDDGRLYVCSAGDYVERAGEYYSTTFQLFTVKNGVFSLETELFCEQEYSFEKQDYEYDYFISGQKVAEDQYRAVLSKYPDDSSTKVCSVDYGISFILERGLLPDPTTVMKEIYAAVLNGDFSAFAGTYKNRFGDSLTLDNQGILTDGGTRYATNQKPISIEVTKAGVICCEIIPVGWIEQEGPILAGGGGVYVGDSYYIYPIGTEMGEYIYTYDEYGYERQEYIPSNPGSDKVRIVYLHWGGSAGLSIDSSNIYY